MVSSIRICMIVEGRESGLGGLPQSVEGASNTGLVAHVRAFSRIQRYVGTETRCSVPDKLFFTNTDELCRRDTAEITHNMDDNIVNVLGNPH